MMQATPYQSAYENHTRKACRILGAEIHAFHVSAPNEGEWVASSSGCFIFGKRDVCLVASLKVVMNCWNQTLPLQFTVTELAVRTGEYP
jgi:hypothetical protein